MIQKLNLEHHNRLLEIWESAVLHTHDFLRSEDFEYYKQNLPTYFEFVSLYGCFTTDNVLVGFMGIAEDSLEMLFIHNDYRRQGWGQLLLSYGIKEVNVKKIDVNEQNKQALDFYLHNGFKQIGRSALDAQGKDYPILHLSLFQ